jgi:hypothetical protein
MTASDILDLISKKYGDKAQMRSFEEVTWYMDVAHTQTWQDHLSRVLSIRLELAREHGNNPDHEANESEFLAEVQALKPGTPLFTFLALSDSTVYSGWATDKKVIHWTHMDRSNVPNQALERTRASARRSV